MKYHTTAHKNKTPVGEMDAFTAILLFIYLFILTVMKASSF